MTVSAATACADAMNALSSAPRIRIGQPDSLSAYVNSLVAVALRISESEARSRADTVLQQATLADVARMLMLYSAPDLATPVLRLATRLAHELDNNSALLDCVVLKSICSNDRGDYVDAVSKAFEAIRLAQVLPTSNGDGRAAMCIASAALGMGLTDVVDKVLPRRLAGSTTHPVHAGFTALARAFAAVQQGRAGDPIGALTALQQIADDHIPGRADIIAEHRNAMLHASRIRLAIESDDESWKARIPGMMHALRICAESAGTPRSVFLLRATEHLLLAMNGVNDNTVDEFAAICASYPVTARPPLSDYGATMYRLTHRLGGTELADRVATEWHRAETSLLLRQQSMSLGRGGDVLPLSKMVAPEFLLVRQTGVAELCERVPGHAYRIANLLERLHAKGASALPSPVDGETLGVLAVAAPFLTIGKAVMPALLNAQFTEADGSQRIHARWADLVGEGSSALIRNLLGETDPELTGVASGVVSSKSPDGELAPIRDLYRCLVACDRAQYPPHARTQAAGEALRRDDGDENVAADATASRPQSWARQYNATSFTPLQRAALDALCDDAIGRHAAVNPRQADAFLHSKAYRCWQDLRAYANAGG